MKNEWIFILGENLNLSKGKFKISDIEWANWPPNHNAQVNSGLNVKIYLTTLFLTIFVRKYL